MCPLTNLYQKTNILQLTVYSIGNLPMAVGILFLTFNKILQYCKCNFSKGSRFLKPQTSHPYVATGIIILSISKPIFLDFFNSENIALLACVITMEMLLHVLPLHEKQTPRYVYFDSTVIFCLPSLKFSLSCYHKSQSLFSEH